MVRLILLSATLCLFLLPGCAVSGALRLDRRDAFGLSANDLSPVPYYPKAFGASIPELLDKTMMTIQQEAGQFLAQPRLLLLRGPNGVVRVQNSAVQVADDNIHIRAPLLSLFSCPTPVGFSFSWLSQP
jgi:hypothetical protein